MVCTCPFTVRVSQLEVVDKDIADLLLGVRANRPTLYKELVVHTLHRAVLNKRYLEWK